MQVIPITTFNQKAFENYILPSVLTEKKYCDTGYLALGLKEKNYACGALAGFLYEDSFRIGSLYIDERIRLYGGGTLLLNRLHDLIGEIVPKIDINYVLNEPERKAMALFLASNGFSKPHPVSHIYTLDCRELKDSFLFSEAMKEEHTEGIQSLYPLKEHDLDQLRQSSMPAFLDPALFLEEAEQRLSFVKVTEHGEIDAFIIFSRDNEDLILSAAYSNPSSKTSGFLPLLTHCVREMNRIWGMEKILRISAINQTSDRLIQKLAKKAILLCQTEYYCSKET